MVTLTTDVDPRQVLYYHRTALLPLESEGVLGRRVGDDAGVGEHLQFLDLERVEAELERVLGREQVRRRVKRVAEVRQRVDDAGR